MIINFKKWEERLKFPILQKEIWLSLPNIIVLTKNIQTNNLVHSNLWKLINNTF